MNYKLMNEKKQSAGRIGGITTLLRYGSAHLREIGLKGGRPQSKTLAQMRQQPAPEMVSNNNQRRMLPNGNSLTGLKELWRERREELQVANSSSLGRI